MSFLSSFKKALGFPDEYDDNDDPDFKSDPDEAEAQRKPDADVKNNGEEDAAECDTADSMPARSEKLAGEIFDGVLELFNSTQPEFVQRSINTEEQRKFVIDNINAGVRKRLEEELEHARAAAERQVKSQQNKSAEEFSSLKKQYHALQQQCEELQTARLSSDRQRRALTDRVRDLEKQALGFEAEREQFQLENRSMANKLRVAAVRQNADSDTEAEMQRLAGEIVELNERVAGLQKEVEAKSMELDASKAENSRLTEEMANMSNDDTLTAEQEQAMAEIEEQIRQFEKIKKKKDAKIAELNSSLSLNATHIAQLESDLSARDNTIKELTAECDSLRKTIETNLYAHATSENELKEEIKRLTELVNAAQAPETQKKPRKQNKKREQAVEKPVEAEQPAQTTGTVKLSAIDELMDNTDWFVAPEPIPVKTDPEVEEDFGYKEPPAKKTARDDDKQLSLW